MLNIRGVVSGGIGGLPRDDSELVPNRRVPSIVC